MTVECSGIQSLDLACARKGREIATLGGGPKEAENTLTKALGVLEEQGVYAMFLYLFAREGRKGVDELALLLRDACDVDLPVNDVSALTDLEGQPKAAREEQKKHRVRGGRRDKISSKRQSDEKLLSKAMEVRLQEQEAEFFEKLEALGGNLDRLLFARDALHKALVYGRYHAKARQLSERAG